MAKFDMPPMEKKAPTEAMIEKVVMDTINKYQSNYGLNLRSQEVRAIVNEVARDVSRAFAYYAQKFDIPKSEVRNTVNQLLEEWDRTGRPPINAFAEVRERIRTVRPEEFKEYQVAAIKSAKKTDAEIAKFTGQGMSREQAVFQLAYENMHEDRRKKMAPIYSVEDVFGKEGETKIARAEKPERREHPSESLVVPERKKEMTPREERAARRADDKRRGEAAEAQARAEARTEREQRQAQRKADEAAKGAKKPKGGAPSKDEIAEMLAKSAIDRLALGTSKATRDVLSGGKVAAPDMGVVVETKKSEPAKPAQRPAARKESEIAEIGQIRLKGGDLDVETAGPGEERGNTLGSRKAKRAEPGVAKVTPMQEVKSMLDEYATNVDPGAKFDQLGSRQQFEAKESVRNSIEQARRGAKKDLTMGEITQQDYDAINKKCDDMLVALRNTKTSRT